MKLVLSIARVVVICSGFVNATSCFALEGDAHTAADRRADALIRQMTQDELIQLVHGEYGRFLDNPNYPSGFIAGIPRLGIPEQIASDAGLGVRAILGKESLRPMRSADTAEATALPSGLATASTWNPQRAFDGGAMIGEEAYRRGANILLGGGVNLVRDPRNGRNFEYAGEDPLLAGTMVGATIAGTQSRHVISTVKHFALNGQESNRMKISSDIDWAAARESDLLAFQIAIEKGQPGSVMSSYNKINSVWASSNDRLLNRILKHDWGFKGYVMSDWGGAHDVTDAVAGLDQESGESFDKGHGGPFFGDKLREALKAGLVPESRLKDMAHRILRTMIDKGLFENLPTVSPFDVAGDAAVARAAEEEGIVLLKNVSNVLPLRQEQTVAIIGDHADVGVLSGGGSSQVWPIGGPAALDPTGLPSDNIVYHPSSPMKAIKGKVARGTKVVFADGSDVDAAARLAETSDVAIVFAYQWSLESHDNANDMLLPGKQNELIARIAALNPQTVVVLETGNPVLMPWLDDVRAVVEAWYPGAAGGEAIANVLYGDVNPSGRLPVTFPASVSQLPRREIRPDDSVDYNIEGAAVGYRGFEKTGQAPLFPFGYGLSYTTFSYSDMKVKDDAKGLLVSFKIGNTGQRAGKETAQVYVGLPGHSAQPKRLAGFNKVMLNPGQTSLVSVKVDPRLLASFDTADNAWEVNAGTYRFYAASSSRDLKLIGKISLQGRKFKDSRIPSPND